jgi:hypothetical protein
MSAVRFALFLILLLTSCGKKQEAEVAVARKSERPVTTNEPLPEPEQFRGTNASEVPISTSNTTEIAKVEFPGHDLYQKGLSIVRDAQDAEGLNAGMKLFREAAELGNPAAQHALGVCSFAGLGVTKNINEAVIWFEKSAAQGYADAEFKIASLYIRGEGVPKDHAKALEFLTKAAEKGHPEAQYNLATLFSTGQSVTKDAAEAARWFQKAAEKGHPIAQSNLGVLYASGEVLEKDMDQALQWWRKAAEQGQPSAQFNLAQALLEGKSLPKDLVEAYKWYSLAAEQGDRDARRMRDALAVELAPSEIADGLKRSREFKVQLHARWETERNKLF